MSEERTTGPDLAKPMQFGTRALLIATAGVALLVVILQALGALWGTLFLWFLLLGAAHVAGNIHGSHRRGAAVPNAPAGDAQAAPPPNFVVRCAPATRLRDNKGFGRVRAILTAASALLGSALGTTALLLFTRTELGGIVLGGLSTGILGGFLGFLGGSFLMVATGAFREAADENRALGMPQGKHAA